MGIKRQGGLPEFDYQPYHSDVLVLRRQDGTFVAAFGAREVTIEDIVEAAKEDYSGSVEARANGASGLPEDEARKAGSERGDGAGRSRPGATARAADAGGDRTRGDRRKAAGDARRGSEARPPPQPAEGGEEETYGRMFGEGRGPLPPLPSERAEHIPSSRPRHVRWYDPKLGGFEWREAPQTDEQALEVLKGSPHSAVCAESYREWRELGASIRAALIRAGEAAEERSETDEGEGAGVR